MRDYFWFTLFLLLRLSVAQAAGEDQLGCPGAFNHVPQPSRPRLPLAVQTNSESVIRGAVEQADRGFSREPLADRLLAYEQVRPLDSELKAETADPMSGIPYMTGEILVPPQVAFGFLGARVAGKVFLLNNMAKDRYLARSFGNPDKPSVFKVYLSLPPAKIKRDLPELIEQAEGAKASSFKFSVCKLQYADRVVVHFDSFEDAYHWAQQMAKRYENDPGDPLPFTHQVGGPKSPVFVGVDERDSIHDPSRRSWRRRVAETLAEAMGLYETLPATVRRNTSREAFVQGHLRERGIDPDYWLPKAYVSK